MRLGVVMMGLGAHAAANAGVMRVLEERGMEIHCVCGLHMGAWPAMLYTMGKSAQETEDVLCRAAQMGRRLLGPSLSLRAMLRRGENALCAGERLERLLIAQAGHRVLALCEKNAVFPCRLLRTGHRVGFSTRAFTQEGVMLSMQASLSFAARAVMALPPLLGVKEFMGSALIGESDAAFACRLLESMGAHRVLVIAPFAGARRKPDAFELAGSALYGMESIERLTHAGVIRIAMPEDAGAADFGRMAQCARAGYDAAREELDGILERMGMACCRVIPFERRTTVFER